MSEFIKYSQDIMEAAKGFRTQAIVLPEGKLKQAFFRASLLHACSFLESHLNYMAEHFTKSEIFSIHEKGVLLEREVRLENGVFILTNNLKISRITDRIELLMAKCSNVPFKEKPKWYSNLERILKSRNSLVHPKEVHKLSESDLDLALTCVLDATNSLYLMVFKKRLPYANKGIYGGLDVSGSLVSS
jgi:hypothetical protein